MARCDLKIDHPKFLAQAGNDNQLQAGLAALRDKLANDHRQGNWYPVQMHAYKDFQRKVWKYDWAPENDRSYGRKGWRLLAYVPDPDAAEPIPATAFVVYEKGVTDNLGPEQIAEILKDFLRQAVEIKAKAEKMHRRLLGGEDVELICWTCYERVVAPSEADADIAEDTHQCPDPTSN